MTSTVQVKLSIQLQDLEPFPAHNICADTTEGDIHQTIVVGSHSDSVPAGPGINDNGKSSLFVGNHSHISLDIQVVEQQRILF